MQNLTTKTIREIALEIPQTTRVFEELKIDYCCGGRVPFIEACFSAGVSPKTVLDKIDNVLKTDEGKEFEWLADATLDRLIAHILEKHHTYTKSEIEQLTPLMAKVANKHGENHPELSNLQSVFEALAEDLLEHMQKEEMILFPYMRDLEATFSRGISASFPPFGTVKNPIRMMMAEHDNAGELLREMRETSHDYALPEGACPSYTALYNRLEALEHDLHQHIHLENNVLFPRATEMEQKTFPLMMD